MLPSQTSFSVIRRNGERTDFVPEKINIAMGKAFLAVSKQSKLASSTREKMVNLTQVVVAALVRQKGQGVLHIEEIQDQVELALMRSGEHEVARSFVLYREARAIERLAQNPQTNEATAHQNEISSRGKGLLLRLQAACKGLTDVDATVLYEEVKRDLYPNITVAELNQALLLATRSHIEREPNYSKVAARLLLQNIAEEVTGSNLLPIAYEASFAEFIQTGIKNKRLNPELATKFDLPALSKVLNADFDGFFDYLGLQTLYDRYFLHIEQRRIELPQAFFMRVAMGLALNEAEPTQSAIEFYQLMSQFDFMASTPTLFNSGTLHSQLSSCYLSTIADSLGDIFDSIKDNALLSKYAGGLGNDWTAVRALGSHIQGTNGSSQGVIPFLKVVNDTAVAVNQGGKRKGAVCAYLEVWHADVEEFLNLRKNTGDDRRRTHDMNTALWLPDLFMQRVTENGMWSLFSPNEAPDLHEIYGEKFASVYQAYETKGHSGKLRIFKQMPAVDLWRKILTQLFETGHPWLTFKDPCNIRNNQNHVGVIHNSNLCTEITLNTSSDEIAVCNLGSVNLVQHLNENGSLDLTKLERTINTAVRMLDNVIDLNFYPVEKARVSNMRHRPIGLGIMGFADALQKLGIAYASDAALSFADESMEAVAYFAFLASANLAKERGQYSSFAGSLVSRGILPIDSLALLERERKQPILVDRTIRLDWEKVRAIIKQSGLRNSHILAIAPTATIANIVGISPSIEPIYQNLYVKSNLSGEFTIINPYLVAKLKSQGLWDEMMLADLKYHNGSTVPIKRIPAAIKVQFATAFEVDPTWLIRAGALRQKWIDQAQSLNLYVAKPNGKALSSLYLSAWNAGLKTTYYLRTLAASHAEKATGCGGELNAVSAVNSQMEHEDAVVALCKIDHPECEACQ